MELEKELADCQRTAREDGEAYRKTIRALRESLRVYNEALGTLTDAAEDACIAMQTNIEAVKKLRERPWSYQQP